MSSSANAASSTSTSSGQSTSSSPPGPPPASFSLADLEDLTRRIYGPGTTPQTRFEAHKALIFLQLSASYVDVCVFILKNSLEPTALLYAAQSLLLVFARDWNNFQPDARVSLKNFLADYLAVKCSHANHFLTKKIMQVLCSLTRRAWVEDPARFADILDYAVEWLQSKDKGELGLRCVLFVGGFFLCHTYSVIKSYARSLNSFAIFRLISDLVCEFDQGRTAFFDESMRRASQV